MTSAARAISPHRFELVRDDGGSLGRVWLYVDEPAAERVFYMWWDDVLDEVRVAEWWRGDRLPRAASELEPGVVEALRAFCKDEYGDVAKLVNRYARES